MFLVVAVSGCATEETDEAPAENATAGPADEQPTGQPAPPAGEAPPVAVDDPGVGNVSLSLSALRGEAPLLVVFNLTAELEDGASWMLDFGDGALEEGVLESDAWSVEHTFEAGVFDAYFNVTYQAGIASRMLTINVTAPAVDEGIASGTDMGSLVYTFSGTITLGSEIPFVQGCGVDSNSQNDHPIEVPLEMEGTPVRVVSAVMDMELGASNADSDIWVYDGAGTLVGESTDWNYVPALGGSGSPTEHFDVTGDWAPGAWNAHVGSCIAVMGSYDVTLTLGFVAA